MAAAIAILSAPRYLRSGVTAGGGFRLVIWRRDTSPVDAGAVAFGQSARRGGGGESMLKIFDLNTCPTTPMANGRGETIRLIDTGVGTEKIDLHFNRLVP